jgi:hypothetical protein
MMKETFAGVAGVGILATTTAITEASPVSLGIAGVVLATVCGAAFWHGRKMEQNTQEMRQVNQRLKDGDKRFDSQDRRIGRIADRVSAIEIKCKIEHKNKTQRVTLEGG